MRRPAVQTGQIDICLCLSQRFRSVHTVSRLSVRSPPRSTEQGCLRWLRRGSLPRAPCVRGCRIADLRRAVADVRHSLPDDVRSDSGSRPEHDPAVSTGQALRARRFEYRMHDAIDRIDAGGAHFALTGEGRDRFGGASYSPTEEINVLRDCRPVPIKSNRTQISEGSRLTSSHLPLRRRRCPTSCRQPRSFFRTQ